MLPIMPFRHAALLILGHGSTLNADSSAPTYQHAEEIRRRKVFGEVHVSFWKEEANFRQALRQIGARQVYVVPNFISSGYFTEEVIPRELGLTGPVTHLDGQAIFYCEPVGLHASMLDALLLRARQVIDSSGEKIAHPAQTACLLICGHGTSFNDNSTKIIHHQAGAIRELGLYADCQGVLMEQKPFVKDWRTLTSSPDVIVVPFFISDGLHSYEDIPVLLGLTHNVKERNFANPHREGSRRLWYATAIGTDPFMADVILAQAVQFRSHHPEAVASSPDAPTRFAPAQELAEALALSPSLVIGQVALSSAYDLLHVENRSTDPAQLKKIGSLEELRAWIRIDAAGRFRPLHAAPSLRSGWIYHATTAEEAVLALDYLYPAAMANWHLNLSGSLPLTPWQETATRQTGRFRIVRELGEDALKELTAQVCEPGCLKQRLWHPVSEPIEIEKREIPLLCPEACNFFVGKARAKIKGTEED